MGALTGYESITDDELVKEMENVVTSANHGYKQLITEASRRITTLANAVQELEFEKAGLIHEIKTLS